MNINFFTILLMNSFRKEFSMANKVIDNSEIWLPKEELSAGVPAIKSIEPVGMRILVEMLTPQEIMGTTLHVKSDADTKSPPQGYVLAIGPMLEADKYGFKAGDRVVLQGNFVPAPRLNNNERQRGLVEVHNIIAVLNEN